MANIGLPKGPGKQLKIREKSVKSQGILEWILSGNSVSECLSPMNLLVGMGTMIKSKLFWVLQLSSQF